MSTKIYVGNLSYQMYEEDLGEVFATFGTVVSARIVIDRATGRSKGFGFVEMSSEAEARAAIEKLNGEHVGGRPLTVNEARPQEPRPPRPAYNSGGNNGPRGGGAY